MKASLSTPPSISVRPAHASIRLGHLWDLSSFDKQNIAIIIVPLSPAMDPSDDVEPSPPKKHRTDYSDAKKATFTNNFEKRHKKKGRARMVHPCCRLGQDVGGEERCRAGLRSGSAAY